jgi:hypothetical protein
VPSEWVPVALGGHLIEVLGDILEIIMQRNLKPMKRRQENRFQGRGWL